MIKSFIAVSIVAATALLSASSAFAQAKYPQANAPVATPPSAAHQLALGSGQPDRCGDVTATARDNPSLRIQQFNGQQNRDTVNAMLSTAASFAAVGNYEQCWHWFDRAQAVVR